MNTTFPLPHPKTIRAGLALAFVLLAGAGALSAAQADISFDGDAGRQKFDELFTARGVNLNGVKWSAAPGGPNKAGQVATEKRKSGHLVYNQPEARFQDATVRLTFSLQQYDGKNTCQAGILFRVDSDPAAPGNGYALILNTIPENENRFFSFRLFSLKNYLTDGGALTGQISKMPLPKEPAPFYTLELKITGNRYSAQVFDDAGNPVGKPAVLADSRWLNPGLVGFRLLSTSPDSGASAYRFAVEAGAETPAPRK
jgi:hypothetical protein